VMRSAYEADFLFYHDSPKRRKVIWYFVPDNREVIPWAHAFGSQIYEREFGVDGELGEQFEPVPWRGGQAPCPEPAKGLCGTEQQWQNGLSISDPSPAAHPGTSVPVCCPKPLVGCCGGLAIGRMGFGRCHMESTFDLFKPFGAPGPTTINIPCQFVEALFEGRGTSPQTTVIWTHYIDVAVATDVVDGCTRTASVNTLNYADGDEVRIPTGGAARYVVVWVTLCDREGTIVKRVYLMRHSA